MGASAGGLEAFQKFFAHMPLDSGMAFVLVQHLDPRHDTILPELLGRSTRMPVQQVRDETPVEPDRVYVIPANASLTIEGGILRVQTPAESSSRRTPIDTLFRSLAEDQAHNAICILFSGSGTDGTLGLRAVKEHGGMTMAQTPESAHHDSIVRSAIATGMVDHVLLPEEMPAKLVEYVGYLRKLRDQRIDEAILGEGGQLGRICELLRRKTGHDFSRYKKGTLVRRIQRRMQVLQAATVTAYVETLRQDPKEVEQLFKDLLIGVTHFFRDPEAFAALARKVVRPIFADAEAGDSLRVWTPGCATGEEAYSVAILLREAMAGSSSRLRVQIFAGDIDDESLEFARRARYPEGIAEQVTPERLERFFVKHGHSYEVTTEIREMCIFSRHNLIKDPPFSRLNLIVCRNLLIYMDAELQRYAASLFHYALRPGGYLFMGPSESIAGPPEHFRVVDKKHRIFQRSETVTGAPYVLPVPEPVLLPQPAHGPQPKTATVRVRQPGLVQKLERILLDNYSPAWVVINAEGETVYFSPRTGRYLEPPPGSPSSNLVDMARKGLRLDLRTAIHKAVKTGQPVAHEGVSVATNGGIQNINLLVRPMSELGDAAGLFIVVFQELAGGKGPAAAADTTSRHGDQMIQQLESELGTTKQHLQGTIEELENSYEELKSSNEELQSSNEELQSTNEELRTSQEELQSVNEELETINLELSKKVEELAAAHSDMHNLLQSTQIPTLFLDNELRIKKFTQAATEVFHIIDTDLGRPITDLAPRFAGGDFVLEIKEVLRTQTAREHRVRLADGSASYVMRVLPYRRAENVVDGIVVTFLDVTQLDRALAHQAWLAAIVETSGDAIVARTLDGVITAWNEAAVRMFGYNEAEAVGNNITLIVPPERLDELEQTHERLKRGDTISWFETVRVAKNGRRIPVSVSNSSIRDPSGRVIAFSASYRDITELQWARETLKVEARKKDEFLALLSHELRNPLAPLRNCLDILRSHPAAEDESQKLLEMMNRQLGHLTYLVDQLMDVSRISSGQILIQRETLDLVELVRTAAEDHRAVLDSAGVKLELRLPAQQLWVDGDPGRLRQAVANLLSNAGKFTERGGSVIVTLRHEPAGTAQVSVRDTGIGMPPDFLKNLFEPFGRGVRRVGGRSGLGLGLALVKRLIEAHGGTVEATSEGPGSGSEFVLRLPLQKDGARHRPPDEAAAAAPSAVKPRRILVVEDNLDAAESLRIMLELAGHQVEVAFEGRAALEKAQAFRPEIVICDIALAGSMDGYALAAAIRRDPVLQSAHLIALTGYGREEDREQAQKAGFDVHLTKPASPAALKRLLADLPAPS